MGAWFGFTLFLGAGLLFTLELMFARMALPVFGGTHSVWTTSMVFYQAALLAGYLYSHLSVKWLGAGRQPRVHLSLVVLPALVLPVVVPPGWVPPAESNPAWGLLLLLLWRVGPPFFILAAAGPLMQKWFSATRHPMAKDPYFLYAAGNAGSLAGLALYPVLAEPFLSLGDQSRIWSIGYGLFVLLTAGCAVFLFKRGGGGAAPGVGVGVGEAGESDRPSAKRRLAWVVRTAVPSGLMLCVTAYMSTDIAPIPLMWVFPLGLYLLSFVIVFSRRLRPPPALVGALATLAILACALVLILQSRRPLWFIVPLHLASFFLVSLASHSPVAEDRPSPKHLTEYFLWISIGGVVGGLFPAFLAPAVFHTMAEYPVLLAVAALSLTRGRPSERPRRDKILDFALPAAMGLATAGLAAWVGGSSSSYQSMEAGIFFGIPCAGCFFFSRRPLRFGLGIGAVMLVAFWLRPSAQTVLYSERNFFGICRVTEDSSRRAHTLTHGTTIHGMQSTDPALRREPLTYYHTSGPIGRVLARLGRGPGTTVAGVGLGAGSIAAYGSSGQRYDFYEIDPAVVRIARDPALFTYLSDSQADIRVFTGDARLGLRGAPDSEYDIMVMDAYSSDSVPFHLLTREALRLYLRKLAPRGVLAFHTSNKYLDLPPVIAALARDTGLASLKWEDRDLADDEQLLGKFSSQWVFLVRRVEDLGGLESDPAVSEILPPEGFPVWTDDRSDIWRVLKWKGR